MSSKSSHLNLYHSTNQTNPTLQVTSEASKASVNSSNTLELKGSTINLVNSSDSTKNVTDLAQFLSTLATSSALASESSARQAAIASESAARAAAVAACNSTQDQARIQAVTSINASIASEANTRSSEVNGLSTEIATERGRIDTLLQGTTVDLDQLAEIVASYSQADTTLLSTINTLQAQVTALQATVDTLTNPN